MLSDVVEAYRRTKKPRDILWNRFVARPLAAVLLVPLARTRVTPNQVTLLTLVVFVAGAAMLAVCPARGALVGSVAILELSYVLDCVDGQLARMKGTSSPVGAHLDFLMDEIKAFVILAACAVRLWLDAGRDDTYLLVGMFGLVSLSTGVALTTFVRRPEIEPARPASTALSTPSSSPSAMRRAVGFAESIAKFLIHYPSYIWLTALLGRLDWYVVPYACVNALYAARTLASVTLRFGRS